MTIRHMIIFRTVCENGYNSTKAAEVLHMTQPAVSLAIKELEQYYGVHLFDRIGRRLQITMQVSIFFNMRYIYPTCFQIWKQGCVIGILKEFSVLVQASPSARSFYRTM